MLYLIVLTLAAVASIWGLLRWVSNYTTDVNHRPKPPVSWEDINR